MITALATPELPRPTPMVEGETRVRRGNDHVLVAVQCVRPDASYRVSVRHASTGAEVGPLSFSRPTQTQASADANFAVDLFRAGLTVAEALDAIGAHA